MMNRGWLWPISRYYPVIWTDGRTGNLGEESRQPGEADCNKRSQETGAAASSCDRPFGS
jgi:hypothetical protein